MKTERINSIFGIILKGVATICIVLITFIYWQRHETGKYQFGRMEESIYIINTTTGHLVRLGPGLDDDQFSRWKISPFEENMEDIIYKAEIADWPTPPDE